MADLSKLADEIGNLTVGELCALTKDLEERWGITLPEPRCLRCGAPGKGPHYCPFLPIPLPFSEEQWAFTVTLTGFTPANKIGAIKILRQMKGLDLSDAKRAVENLSAVPLVLVEATSRADAEEIRARFREVGATVTIT